MMASSWESEVICVMVIALRIQVMKDTQTQWVVYIISLLISHGPNALFKSGVIVHVTSPSKCESVIEEP